MLKYQAPEGTDKVSVEQQQFNADEKGCVLVPDHFGPKLAAIGWKQVANDGPATSVVTQEQLTDPAKPADPVKIDDVLLGSNVLPALVDVGAKEPVQLGVIVAEAHKHSGLSAEDWNAQTEEELEAALQGEVERQTALNKTRDVVGAMRPGEVRAWLADRGVKLDGVKNGDLGALVEASLQEKGA